METITILFSDDTNFKYYTNLHIDGAFYVVEEDTIYVNKMNYTYAKSLFGRVKIWRRNSLKQLVKGKKLRLNYENIPAHTFVKLQKIANTEDISGVLLEKRRRKRKSEVNNIKRAGDITLNIIHNIDIKGKTEIDIANELLKETFNLGLDYAFKPIVATYNSSKYPHYKPRKKKIERFVLIDFGVKYKDYCGDITEVIFIDKTYKKKYEQLKEVFFEIVDKLSDLMYGYEVDQLYKEIYKQKHLRLMPHLIGHGIGLDVHEKPWLNKNSKDRLKYSVIAIEPSVYGRYGLRYEREVYIGKRPVMLNPD